MTSLSVRRVQPEDYQSVEALKRRYGLPAYTEAEWRHIYVRNPLLRKTELDWPWGWVLVSDDGSVVGHLGNVPVEYTFSGRRVAAAAASDWVVAEEHRSNSLQLVLQFFRANPAELLLNTTAAAYGRAYEKLGASRPPGVYDRNAFWPVNRRAVAAAVAMRRGLPSSALTERLVATGLIPIAAARWLVTTSLATSLSSKVETVHAFDQRFDDLWARLSSRRELICVRDAEALDWRFGRGLRNGRVWVHLLAEAGAISAYVIVAISSEDGFVRARVLDYYDGTSGLRRTAALVASVVQRCREEGVDAVQANGVAPHVMKRFRALGAAAQQVTPFMYYFRATSPALQKALEEPGGWTPGPYDGDGHCGTPALFGLPD